MLVQNDRNNVSTGVSEVAWCTKTRDMDRAVPIRVFIFAAKPQNELSSIPSYLS